MIDRAVLCEQASKPLFRGRLLASQAKAIGDVIGYWEARHESADPRWLAYVLATIHHETAGSMQPLPEIGLGRGKPYGLPDPITGQVYYGRGLVQLTWKYNYAVQARRLRLDLVNNPGLALSPSIAIAICVDGMVDGVFTGDCLGDYFNARRDDPVGARRVVNGQDQALTIAGLHGHFLAALETASGTPTARPPLAVVRSAGAGGDGGAGAGDDGAGTAAGDNTDALNQAQLDALNAGTVIKA